MTTSVMIVVTATVGVAEDSVSEDGFSDDGVAEVTTGPAGPTLGDAGADAGGATGADAGGGTGPVVVFTIVHGHLVMVMLVASVTVYVISLTLKVVGLCKQVSNVFWAHWVFFTYWAPSGEVISGQHSRVCVDSGCRVVGPSPLWESTDSDGEPKGS